MQIELRQIQRKVGTTTILVTHDQAEAMSISDRVVVMEGGRMTQVDAPYRLLRTALACVHLFLRRQDQSPRWRHGGAKATLARSTSMALLEAPSRIFLTERPSPCRSAQKRSCWARPATGRLDGHIASRFFLGSQWLFTRGRHASVRSTVAIPNQGGEPPAEGAQWAWIGSPPIARDIREEPGEERGMAYRPHSSRVLTPWLLARPGRPALRRA